MALVGNMIATSFAGNPSLVNYDMFVAAFSMLSLFYLIGIHFREQFTFHKFVPATLDLLNALFFFCAAVATAAELGAHSCSNSVSSMHGCHATNTDSVSATPSATTSQTAHTTPRSDVEKLKHPRHSCGSAGYPTWEAWC